MAGNPPTPSSSPYARGGRSGGGPIFVMSPNGQDIQSSSNGNGAGNGIIVKTSVSGFSGKRWIV